MELREMTERLVLVEESVWDRYQMLGEPLRGRLDDPREIGRAHV